MNEKLKHFLIDLFIGSLIGVVISFIVYGFIYMSISNKSEAQSLMWIGFILGMPIGIIFTFPIAHGIRKNKKIRAKNAGFILDALHKYNVTRTKFSKCSYFDLEIIADYKNERLWFLNWGTGYWQYWSFSLVVGFDVTINNTESGGGFYAYSIGSTIVGQELSTDVTNSTFEMVILNTKEDFRISLTKQLRGQYTSSRGFVSAVNFAIESKQIIEELVQIDIENHKS